MKHERTEVNYKTMQVIGNVAANKFNKIAMLIQPLLKTTVFFKIFLPTDTLEHLKIAEKTLARTSSATIPRKWRLPGGKEGCTT